MSQTAAHLVDHVIPHVPVRQWVLSLPIPLRVLLAAQPQLVTPVLQVVHRSAANLNIHLHCLVLDGVYLRGSSRRQGSSDSATAKGWARGRHGWRRCQRRSALAAAEVGIAMGSGTDVAMESSGVTLLKGDLMGIVSARNLSKATMRNIRQNLFLSFAYNVAGIPIAAGVLYPITGMLLSPAVAAAAMALSSVSVIANALRLRSTKLEG